MTRSPLRISLGGGGTDLPSYYQEHGGFLIAAAIDKYVYITDSYSIRSAVLLKYSQMEEVGPDRRDQASADSRVVANCWSGRIFGWRSPAWPTFPPGTGLGSSGSFTTALLKALHVQKKNLVHPRELAEQACKIEIDILKEPVGKQDQYIAAYGGITCFRFCPTDRSRPGRSRSASDTLYDLEDHLLLVLHRIHALGRRNPQGTGRQEQEKRSRA